MITKSSWNWKQISFSKSLNVHFLAMHVMIFYHMISIWRIQREKQWKYIFLWYFMKKIWKTRKYRFWLQKVVKIWIWQHFIDGQSSNCVSLHFSIILGQIFFVIRSHGFDGLFAAFDVAWKSNHERCDLQRVVWICFDFFKAGTERLFRGPRLAGRNKYFYLIRKSENSRKWN